MYDARLRAGDDVVGPEADLVVVAQAVAVLGAVEGRRRRVRDEEVHGLVADLDRHVPVRLGREPEVLELVRGVPVRRRGGGRVVGQQRARHVGPPEGLERAHRVGVDGVPRVDDHAVLAGEEPEAEGVVTPGLGAGFAHDAVVVEVVAARDPGVGRRDVRVGVVDRTRVRVADLEEVVAEQVHGLRVVVELVDQQHVGARALDGLGHVVRLPDRAGVGVRVGQVGGQAPGGGAVERGVERREAHRVALRRGRLRAAVRGRRSPGPRC